jgi:glycosyltransferase involved in cell wall biosynthesis
MKPLVTVIGISYNHEAFIREALSSIWGQTYDSLQVILMDDASTDGSRELIADLVSSREQVAFIPHEQNKGYINTFNEALKLVKGEFVVDFSLDDVMEPGFIEKSVAALMAAGPDYGVSFTNAVYIDSQSQVTDNHYGLLKKKGMIREMPQGDVFEMVVRRYFICTPTMLIRKEVFDRQGPYDNTLAFEDFDFWVRSSRYFKYVYTDEVLMKKRKLKNSLSAHRYRHWENEQLTSVFKVCQKAFALCKTMNELKALRSRLFYEYRQALRSDNAPLATQHRQLMIQAGGNTILMTLSRWLMKLGFDYRRA